MMMARVLLIALVGVALASWPLIATAANGPEGGFKEPDGIDLVNGGDERTRGVGTDGDGVTGVSGSAETTYPYTRDELGNIFLNESCGPNAVVGEFDVFLVTGPGEERFLRTEDRCTPIPELDDADPEDLPALTEAGAQAIISELLPIPVARLSPDAEHGSITGLETHVWYGDDGRLELEPARRDGRDTLGATVSDRSGPYRIEASVWIEEYRWDMDDGTTLTATRPGSEDDPAATHVYETKSEDYEVTVTTVWRGTYRWSAGPRDGEGDMGSLAVEGEPVPYPVQEVRAVPADPDES